MHQERLIAIDTIILSSESTLNHSKLAQHSIGKKTDSLLGTLWFKHFTFKQLPLLNLSRASEGRCENLLWCRRQIWAPHAFWPAGAQRKTLVREGRNLCAINCLSLKRHFLPDTGTTKGWGGRVDMAEIQNSNHLKNSLGNSNWETKLWPAI